MSLDYFRGLGMSLDYIRGLGTSLDYFRGLGTGMRLDMIQGSGHEAGHVVRARG